MASDTLLRWFDVPGTGRQIARKFGKSLDEVLIRRADWKPGDEGDEEKEKLYVFYNQADGVRVCALTEIEGVMHVLVILEWRMGAMRPCWGFPTGTIDPTETDPADAARREVLEETGYKIDEIVQLFDHDDPTFSSFMNPANSRVKDYCFLGLGLRKVGAGERGINHALIPFNKWVHDHVPGPDMAMNDCTFRVLRYLGRI